MGDGDGDGDGDTETIDAPDDLSGAVENGAIELTWNAVDAAESYNVYRSKGSIETTDGSPLASEVSETTYLDETAQRDTTYNYRVTSLDSSGTESDLSDGVEIEVPFEAPNNLEASTQSGTVELSWDAGTGAETYNVYRSTDSVDTANDSPLATGVSGTSYSDGSVESGKAYYYALTSVASDDSESGLSEQQRVQTSPASPSSGGGTGEWTRVKVATDNDVNDVAITSAGAYAVADNGILLKRTDTEWTAVLQDGVSGNGNALLGLDVTDDGERLWLVGASGRIGEWDVSSGSLEQDHSAPNDVTNNFQDVAVTGDEGLANVYITDGSGLVHSSTDNGTTWNQSTPGSGSALRAIDTYGAQSGHTVDANKTVFQTTDGGGSWAKTGDPGAGVSLYGVDSDASDDVWMAAGSGTVYRWDGAAWMTTAVGESALKDIEVAADDQSGYVVGGSAAVFSYDGSSWSAQGTPVTNNLNAVVLGTDSTPPIAVGAGGTVIER